MPLISSRKRATANRLEADAERQSDLDQFYPPRGKFLRCARRLSAAAGGMAATIIIERV
ncbi:MULTISPECIES: hypothetical protein [unclassified Bradyrhizobium]|uniref:hypothetical protein n=1 Tax=unclassified Bradyrhizobium TaxID=2631580 RepID=UPI001BAB17D2|nr:MULTISPECIES: hypothetical protein [unclassified Bradyrhizobium]MBR1203860.1 hypothetical protein [Bradyrhizobium sp. AUGA SZCCT0124]MBR1310253.1 hypothetical protein [Bradyrhizobium sp. AUGA SZCCT0051]MBR1340395.1 hypothetical protein [Bradyrhizobium sp. AUGA SZCCT0105]MBR1355002.1 hypothetical protein [Bradyrhizobium sp. AUGA SZCCT0045]